MADTKFREAALAVFSSLDPFDAPFVQQLTTRRLVYPATAPLSEHQFSALMAAAHSEGDDTMLAAITEGMSITAGGNRWTRWWEFHAWDYTGYADESEFGVLEHCLCSPSGKWGLLFSHEQHCIVGGSRGFVQMVLSAFPGHEDSVERFRRFWKRNNELHGADLRWLPVLLGHLT